MVFSVVRRRMKIPYYRPFQLYEVSSNCTWKIQRGIDSIALAIMYRPTPAKYPSKMQRKVSAFLTETKYFCS
jgi:hypothetical protein